MPPDARVREAARVLQDIEDVGADLFSEAGEWELGEVPDQLRLGDERLCGRARDAEAYSVQSVNAHAGVVVVRAPQVCDNGQDANLLCIRDALTSLPTVTTDCVHHLFVEKDVVWPVEPFYGEPVHEPESVVEHSFCSGDPFRTTGFRWLKQLTYFSSLIDHGRPPQLLRSARRC